MKATMINPKVFLFFSFSLLVSMIWAGEERDYAWLKLQSGIELYHERQYGDAMVLFSECKELKRRWPEVEFWIGRIYEVEGDYQLAEKHYLEAHKLFDMQGPFYTDRVFETMLHLSDVYLKLGKPDQFLNTLNTLLDQGSGRGAQERNSFYESIKTALSRGGLNKVLELYRIQSSFEIEVYRRKSEHFVSVRNWEKARINLTLGVLSSLSTVIGEMEKMDPNFLFTTELNAAQTEDEKIRPVSGQHEAGELELLTRNIYSDLNSLIRDAARHAYIRDYIEGSSLMENLYRLAGVLHEQGDSQLAVDVLWLCIRYPYNELWSRNANRLFLEITTAD